LAFRYRPVFSVVAGLRFLIYRSNCQDELKVGGSRVDVIPLCRFLYLPIMLVNARLNFYWFAGWLARIANVLGCVEY